MFNLFSSTPAEPEIITLEEPMHFVGVTMETNVATFSKDLKKLARKVNMAKLKNEISHRPDSWAFVTVTKNFDPDEGYMDLIVGEVVTRIGLHLPEEFSGYDIPAGTYAVFRIRPKATFLWESTIRKTKAYIFTQWLPQSGYEKGDAFDDLELHDVRSTASKPEIDLYIPIRKK